MPDEKKYVSSIKVGSPEQIYYIKDEEVRNSINNFQTKLIAGNNITINENGVISAEAVRQAPQRINLTATAGQTSFTIPFEYDSLSSNLTVYLNGILMKEGEHYSVNTSNNTVNLIDASAEAGDIITIMGILGATSINFDEQALRAQQEIVAAVENARTEINGKVNAANQEINEKVSDGIDIIEEELALIDDKISGLPTEYVNSMFKNATNRMAEGSKIVMDTNYAPSENGDVTTKQYVDNAISLATAAIVTDIWYAGATAPSNTKLLWIDSDTSTGGLKYYNGSAWVHVPVAWS